MSEAEVRAKVKKLISSEPSGWRAEADYRRTNRDEIRKADKQKLAKLMSKCNTCGVLKKKCCDKCKGIPLADRKPDTVTSGRKLNAALKNERILGGGKVL